MFLVTFLIQGLLNRVKLVKTKRKSRNELGYLNILSSYKLDDMLTNSLPSETFTAYEVDFLVFSGTTLSTSRFIFPFVTKTKHSPILTLILIPNLKA